MKMKWAVPSEKEIQNSILYFLSFQVGCFAFQINTTGVYDPQIGCHRKPGKYVLPGTPDVIACVSVKGIPVFVGFEVKTPTGRQSENQKHFEEALKSKAGGYYFIVRSIKDVEEALEIVRNGVIHIAGLIAPTHALTDK